MYEQYFNKVCIIVYENDDHKKAMRTGLILDYTDRLFYLNLQSVYFLQHHQMSAYKTIRTNYISPKSKIYSVEEIEDYEKLVYRDADIIGAIFTEDLKTP